MNVKVLDVYLHETFVGILSQDIYANMAFKYDPNYVNSNGCAISISMPKQVEPYSDLRVKAFFSGLLPDEQLRTRLAKYLGLSEENPFALLSEVGGECAGALSLLPKGIKPQSNDGTNEIVELDLFAVSELLQLLKQKPLLAGQEGMRLSLAGAQDKLAVRYKDGALSLVKGSLPTTHILKPAIEHIHDSVLNEFFCMKLAAKVGLKVPEVFLHPVGDTYIYIVERYDRTLSTKQNIVRLHQEDFCQAIGIMPELKYEREGGPSIAQIQKIIQHHCSSPVKQKIDFIERILFNFIIGNADAHGKNFSLLYDTANNLVLSPVYDVLSTAVYPDLSSKMAMKIGGKYKPQDIALRHWMSLVPATKTAQLQLTKRILSLSQRIEEASISLEASLKQVNISSPIFTQIIQVIKDRNNTLRI